MLKKCRILYLVKTNSSKLTRTFSYLFLLLIACNPHIFSQTGFETYFSISSSHGPDWGPNLNIGTSSNASIALGLVYNLNPSIALVAEGAHHFGDEGSDRNYIYDHDLQVNVWGYSRYEVDMTWFSSSIRWTILKNSRRPYLDFGLGLYINNRLEEHTNRIADTNMPHPHWQDEFREHSDNYGGVSLGIGTEFRDLSESIGSRIFFKLHVYNFDIEDLMSFYSIGFQVFYNKARQDGI